MKIMISSVKITQCIIYHSDDDYGNEVKDHEEGISERKHGTMVTDNVDQCHNYIFHSLTNNKLPLSFLVFVVSSTRSYCLSFLNHELFFEHCFGQIAWLLM